MKYKECKGCPFFISAGIWNGAFNYCRMAKKEISEVEECELVKNTD